MKKIITLLFILPLTLVAQDSTRLTAKYVYEDVKAGFYKLVNTLQGPAKYTYESYVRQYFLTGISIGISLLITIIISTFFLSKSFKKGEWDNGEPNAWGVGQVVFSITTGVLTIILLYNISGIITNIFNPQYFAIKEVIKTIK